MIKKENTGKIFMNKEKFQFIFLELRIPAILIFIVFFSLSVRAQHNTIPLSDACRLLPEKELTKSRKAINTGFKPLLQSRIYDAINIDSLNNYEKEIFFKKYKNTWFTRKFLFEDFAKVNTKDFTLSANPILYVQSDKLRETDESYLVNTRGLEIKGTLGDKISYYTSFRENQAFFRTQTDSFIQQRLVVPGQGARKDFKENGHDYASASGYLSYSPVDFLNLQLGHRKHFIGEGYRSMLLSDNSFSYPFIEVSATYKGFQYNSFVTQFEDFEGIFYYYHQKKHAAFNYLSYNFKNRIEIGLFEGVIYHTIDTTDYSYNLPADFYIPIIGARTLSNLQNTEHNFLSGLNMKIIPTDFVILYGQTAFSPVDDGIAFQAGIKIFDLFFDLLPSHSLFFQAEYNEAKNRIYSHAQGGYQVWSHYNQEIAHPGGTNFSEIIMRSRYNFKRIFLKAEYFALKKNSTESDIYISADDLLNEINSIDLQEKLVRFQTGVVINPAYNLELYIGTDYRSVNSQKTQFLIFGLRTNIFNFYTDF